jgi:hypothetical protein
MANKKISPERTPTVRKQFAFVKYELNDEEKAECKATEWSLEIADSHLIRLSESGYAVSLKWDGFHKCCAAFLTTKDEKSPNFNLCLSGRGSSPMKALKQLMYKHAVTEGVWPTPEFTNDVVTEFDD